MHSAEKATQLVRQLRNSRWIPAYQETTIQDVAADITDTFNLMAKIVQNGKEKGNESENIPALQYHHRTIQRNIRCILCYLMNRLWKIETVIWESGGESLKSVEDNLSFQEKSFIQGYTEILGRYTDAIGLDLAADLQPPHDLYIEVRVLKDCGTIYTNDGPVTLQPGSAHFLKRSDVEHLVRQGFLEHIT